jgi:hypothetical protein
VEPKSVQSSTQSLDSYAAFARYDCGDTWSPVEPKSVQSSAQSLDSHAAFARYDGGDTWSELEPKPLQSSAQSVDHDVHASVAPDSQNGGR